MPDTTEPRAKSAVLTVAIAAGLLMLPVAYVLSIGPVRWLVDHDYMKPQPGSAIVVFYWALEWLCENCSPLSKALDWYVSFWSG